MHHRLDSTVWLQIQAQYIGKWKQVYLQRLNLFNRLRDNHIIVIFSLFPLLQGISYWGVLIRSHFCNQNLNSNHNEMFCLKKSFLYTSGILRIMRPSSIRKALPNHLWRGDLWFHKLWSTLRNTLTVIKLSPFISSWYLTVSLFILLLRDGKAQAHPKDIFAKKNGLQRAF